MIRGVGVVSSRIESTVSSRTISIHIVAIARAVIAIAREADQEDDTTVTTAIVIDTIRVFVLVNVTTVGTFDIVHA